jgi:REP element-mobilizing transposase RayT
MQSDNYPQRKSIRLSDNDYAQQGAYFVTICTYNRQHLFGDIDSDGIVHCNDYGNIVWACWRDLPKHYNNIQLDEFVVMPNHIHAIIFIVDATHLNSEKREGHRPSPTDCDCVKRRHGLTEIIRALKSFSARRINQKRNATGLAVWQRTFHDRIVRNDTELNKLREYVLHNPVLWAEDRYYSDAT